MINIYYLQTGIVGFLFLWLVILTILTLKLKSHYNHLIAKTHKKYLEEVLEEILKIQKDESKDIENIKKTIIDIIKDNSFNLQQIGFHRFNPFDNTGGDQSFSLSILDKNKNGMVFSFLHSRDTTRVYAKEVFAGKSTLELSKEEEKVIQNAKTLKS